MLHWVRLPLLCLILRVVKLRAPLAHFPGLVALRAHLFQGMVKTGRKASGHPAVIRFVPLQAVAPNGKLLSRQGKTEGSCHAVGAPPRGEAVGQGGSRDPGTSNGCAECRPPFPETRRWRAGGGGGLDLSGSLLESLRPLILQLVKEAVAQALKDLVPGVGHSSVGPSAAFAGNEKPRKPGKGKGPGAPKQVAAGQAPPQNIGQGQGGQS